MTRLIVKGEVVYSTSTEEGNLRITNGILGTDNWLRVSTPGDARMVVSIPNARRLLIATPPNYKHLVEQIEELTGFERQNLFTN